MRITNEQNSAIMVTIDVTGLEIYTITNSNALLTCTCWNSCGSDVPLCQIGSAMPVITLISDSTNCKFSKAELKVVGIYMYKSSCI